MDWTGTELGKSGKSPKGERSAPNLVSGVEKISFSGKSDKLSIKSNASTPRWEVYYKSRWNKNLIISRKGNSRKYSNDLQGPTIIMSSW